MFFLLYSSGILLAILLLFKIFYDGRGLLNKREKFLAFSVALIPFGKLVYLPIPGLIGMKFSFIFAALISVFWFVSYGVSRHSLSLVFVLLIPLLSLVYIENYDWLLIYQLTVEQADSSVLRFISLFVLVGYSTVIYSAIVKNTNLPHYLIKYYILAVLYVSLFGVYIFIFVLNGTFTAEDLAPISSGVHIVGKFFRFNPGANVNEFSMILAYAIFLIPLTRFSKTKKITFLMLFSVLEFATLTRASWIALILGAFSGKHFMDKNFIKKVHKKKGVFSLCLLLFVATMTFLYFFSPEIKEIIDSRTSFELGASGNERLEKFAFVFSRIFESGFRFIFGYGWATNMYVHNVYLQLLYEIGFLGLIVFLGSIIVYIAKIYFIPKGLQKTALVSMFVFLATVSLMHHNLYHTQTWFILGLIAGIASLAGKRSLGEQEAKHHGTL